MEPDPSPCRRLLRGCRERPPEGDGRMRRAAMERLAAEVAGGQRWTEDEARRVLDAWEASGESDAAFARRLGNGPRLHRT